MSKPFDVLRKRMETACCDDCIFCGHHGNPKAAGWMAEHDIPRWTCQMLPPHPEYGYPEVSRNGWCGQFIHVSSEAEPGVSHKAK